MLFSRLPRTIKIACLICVSLLTMLCWTVTAPPSYAEGLQNESLPKSWQAEAALNDVCFVDQQTGWAVGDSGTILRTNDGGQSWQSIGDVSQKIIRADYSVSLSDKLRGVSDRRVLQAQDAEVSAVPPVRCRLTSVHFIDRSNGWIAGGYAVPYLDRTRSTILRTRDGGQTWNVVGQMQTPAIEKIQFTDARNGWAIGASGNRYRGGIWFTFDGGNHWSTDPPETMRRDLIQAVRITDRQNQPQTIAIDEQGVLIRSVGGHGAFMENAVVIGRTRHRFSDVAALNEQHVGNQHLIAVGDQGAFFESADDGASWRAAKLEWPVWFSTEGPASLPDFRKITVTPSKIWIVTNDPSTFVAIDRTNQEVSFHETPVTSAIHQIEFLDDQIGFAVGDLGVVLSTTDGGQSWNVQRGHRNGLSVLNVCLDTGSVPLNLMADLACENNILLGTAIVRCATPANAPQNNNSTHLRQAIDRCGSVSLEWIDAPPEKSEPKAEKHAQKNNQMEQRWIVKLVRLLRSTRPETVVLSGPLRTARHSRGRGTLNMIDAERLIKQAIHLAADSGFDLRTWQHSDNSQTERVWQVRRLSVRDFSGNHSLDSNKLLPTEGVTIAERIMISRALMGQRFNEERTEHFRSMRFIGRGPGGGSTTVVPDDSDLLNPKSHRVVRSPRERGSSSLAIIERGSQKRTMFERMLTTDVHDPVSIRRWQNDMLSLTLSSTALNDGQGGNWMMEFADACYLAGKTELASRTLKMLVDRFPDHAWSPAATLWLANYFASDEHNLLAFHAAKAASYHQTNLATGSKAPSSIAGVGNASASTSSSATGSEIGGVTVEPNSNGDQRVAWQRPEATSLQQKIDTARAIREQQFEQANGVPPVDEEYAEFLRLSSQIDRHLQPAGDAVPDEAAHTVLTANHLENQPRTHGKSETVGQSETDGEFNTAGVATESNVRLASATTSNQDVDSFEGFDDWMRERYRLSATWLSRLKTRDGDLGDAPMVLGTELRLMKHLDDRANWEASLQAMRKRCLDTDFLDSFQAETQRLLDLKPVTGARSQIRCIAATERPRLDGRIDDGIWKTAYAKQAIHRIPLHQGNDPNVRKQDAVMLAYDDQFVFFLARMNRLIDTPPDKHIAASNSVRPRDPDLNGRDRIRIFIDTDSDRRSEMVFEIDHRGWVAERMGSIVDWNPQWFVARQADQDTWTVEAAIPRTAFLGLPESADFGSHADMPDRLANPKLWSIRLQRTRWQDEQFWESRDSGDPSPVVSGLMELVAGKRSAKLSLIFESLAD